MLGERVALANPLDYHTYVWGDPDAMAAAFTAMVRGPADLHLLFADLPRADRCADDDWVLAVDAFARACATADARGALVAAMAGNLTGERAATWVRRRAGGARPARRRRGGGRGRGDDRPRPGRARRAAAGRRARRRRVRGTTVLNEATGKRLLRVHGVPVPDGAVCASAGAAVIAAADLRGPVAVKGLGIAHKTEHSAVRLGLAEPADVRAAAAVLLARYPAVLVERLVPAGSSSCWSGVETRPGVRAGAHPRRRAAC